MSVDRKNEATDVEDTNNLSRRSFLVRLAVVGIGSAIGTSASVTAAHATADSEIASGAKDVTNSETSPTNKTAEVVQQVDPNDPLQHFNQPYYRHRRRVARRVYRRSWRYTRRVYRRRRRYTRRVYRRARRRYYY
jgi:carbonic anhydrase/acetyltransferase-like protein (isoleucine patch superfamily)